MGLFDFFKKKENKDKKEEQSTSLFQAVEPYGVYLMLYVRMQSQGNYAPIAAYEAPNGEMIGFLYVNGEDDSYSFSATEAIDKMTAHFEQQLEKGALLSYAIFYHSSFNKDGNHAVALRDTDLKAISMRYHFKKEGKGALALPYKFQKEEITYAGIEGFAPEEIDRLFNIPVEEGKDYFQDREEIIPPSEENEIGLLIKKSNTHNLHNTWSGIFGFDTYSTEKGAQPLQEHAAIAINKAPSLSTASITIRQLDYEDIVFKTISEKDVFRSILPVVKTDYLLDFETKGIQEWENVANLEAIVSGRGRATFGLWFFATDYAENRTKYLTQKNFSIHVSGIAFVVDRHQPSPPSEDGPNYSEDFTAYMPNNDLPNYACFDFVGVLEDFRTTTLLEDNSLQGYILTVRMITNPDQHDFFTIDLYVAPENMRFETLVKGMKLTGMFQMQGCMV
ncbi:MAG: hypothetical protein ACRBFS_01475 [Aureispira sp.]